ncbi:MAG: FAD-dependent oxidoreductase [Microcystaceae cyanobacterium]
MIKDYDLVIIGDTSLSRYTALTAINFNYRVALVQQRFSHQREGIETLYRQKWSYLSCLSRQNQKLKDWEIVSSCNPFNFTSPTSIPWWQESYQAISLSDLLEKGVDVILESGKFEIQPNLTFITETRNLLAKSYLIATGYGYSDTQIQGLTEVGYLDFIQASQQVATLPENLAIIAETSMGIELAQALNRLGKTVTLIVEDACLLPQEERDIIPYLQAQLEAEGIKLFVNTPVTHVKLIEQKKWLEIGGHAIASDELIITSYPQPNFQGLNIEEIGIKFDKRGIKVNHKQQTTLSNIYAIGGVTGNYQDIARTQAEAAIALNNIMGIRNRKKEHVPDVNIILTDPRFIRMGLTEQQARQQYEDKLIIINLNFHQLPQRQLFDEMNGKLKIITRLNGQILGAHILGYYAEEYMNTIAIAMEQKIPLVKLKASALTSASFAYIISQAALQWQQKKLKSYQKWPRFLQKWLISL